MVSTNEPTPPTPPTLTTLTTKHEHSADGAVHRFGFTDGTGAKVWAQGDAWAFVAVTKAGRSMSSSLLDGVSTADVNTMLDKAARNAPTVPKAKPVKSKTTA